MCGIRFYMMLFAGGFLCAQAMHQVQEGDTLYSISRQHQIPVTVLIEINSITDPGSLQLGSQLLIPSDTLYQVKPGDTLYSIARKYYTTVEILQQLNDLRGTVISVGSVLSIPSTGTKPPAGPVASSSVSKPIVESVVSSSVSWPVTGARTPLTGKFPGVAITAEEDSPVQAVRGGRVIYAGPHSSFGNVVFVQSPGGYVYVYAGQKTLSVELGQEVRFGQEVGILGETSISPTVQLYFSVWKNKSFVNPEQAPRG